MPGDIFYMTSWTTRPPGTGMSASISVKDRKKVGVFAYLGDEPKDGSAPLDLEKAMNELGWYRKPAERKRKRN
jgi:hypothetical protein